MGPILLDIVDDRLKDVIQNLYEIQSAVHGYLGPETQQQLVHKVSDLSNSLSTLSTYASSLPTEVPPEIIDYVDEGRNPDIYTREFVELAQKSNEHLKAKCEAFAGFRDALGKEMLTLWPELKEEVALRIEGKSKKGPPKENGDAKENQS